MANTLNLGTDGNWATKEDSLLAYNSENGNFKPLPFDFTRASSATVVNKAGLIETVGSGEPRIDFKDDAKGALLLEPSRSNLITYSEDFSNAYWSKNGGTTIINNFAISPDGTLNASRYLGTGTSGLGIQFTTSLGLSYTVSFYVKSNVGINQSCRLIFDSSNISSDFIVTTEWQKISFTSVSSGASNKTCGIFRDSSDNDLDILIYGAQLEQSSYPTSYIPTQGSAVTRVADNCSIDNLDDYVSSGTSWTATGEFIKGQDKDNSLYIFYAKHLASSNLFRIRDFANYVSFYLFIPIQSNINYGSSLGDTIKWAIRAKSDGSYSVYVNGVSRAEANGTFQKLDKYTINGSAKNKIKDLRVYNTALTDAELQALTT